MGSIYSVSDPCQFAETISVPMLAINALDDPVCVAENIEPELFRANPNLILATTAHGSHLAFYEGPRAVPWVDEATVQFFDAVLSKRLHNSARES